jgi:hypothetical protein
VSDPAIPRTSTRRRNTGIITRPIPYETLAQCAAEWQALRNASMDDLADGTVLDVIDDYGVQS